MESRKSLTQLLGLSLIVIFLIACTDNGSGSGSDSSLSLSMPLDLQMDPALKISTTLDASGGEIQSVGSDGSIYRLTLPSNALNTSQEISLTPVTDIGSYNFIEQFIAGIQFAPDGQKFDLPTTLEITLPSGLVDANLLALTWDGEGENVSIKLFTIKNNKLILSVTHFSGVAIIVANANNVSSALTSQATQTIEHQYISLITQFIQTQLQNTTDYYAALTDAIDLYATKWVQDINAFVQSNLGDRQTIITSISELTAWENNILLLVCASVDCSTNIDEFNQALTGVRTEITKSMIVAFEQARDIKDDSEVVKLLADVVLLGAEYEALFRSILALSTESVLLEELEYLYARQLEITLVDFPEELTVGGDATAFSIRFTLAKNGSVVPDLDVMVGPNIDGCGVISQNDSSPSRGLLSLKTDASGVIDGLSLAAGTSCSPPLDKSIIHITTGDSLQRTDQFFGDFLSRRETFSSQNVGEQLIIQLTGFPGTIVPGQSKTFSVRFSLLSNDKPLALANVNIGPNNQGCASINNSRGYESYTTDSNGEVTGLTLSANESSGCTPPLDRSQVYIKVDDATVAAFTNSDKPLGTEIIYEAVHKKQDISLTLAEWNLSAGVSAQYCRIPKANNDCDPYDRNNFEAQYGTPYGAVLPNIVDESITQMSSSGGGTSANAQVTTNLSISLPSNLQPQMTISLNSQISISVATGFRSDSLDQSSSLAFAGVGWNNGYVSFEITNRQRDYSLSWERTGFTEPYSYSWPRKTYSVLSGPGIMLTTDTPATENAYNISGTLQPGKYTLTIYCTEIRARGNKFYDKSGGSTYSNAGSCALNFVVK